ncbi:Glycosyl transferase [Macleaya cordata]|uniref:Glycosyl transferase n=1 Tax=Macleaya cordata TaxID=56857 RepID=A0A200QJ06_MACCD|nr:Glycosyl transferase [Macleaya cordata]
MLQIYWGHGIYGIESASFFYFGKHPSLLSLGESAMLAGIIPAPEIRSPLKDPNRGKTSQVRALRRMVEVSYLDIVTALAIMEEPLHLRIDVPQHSNRLHFSEEEVGNSGKQRGTSSTAVDIWDWERESSMWELREYMERWAVRIQKRSSAVIFAVKSN